MAAVIAAPVALPEDLAHESTKVKMSEAFRILDEGEVGTILVSDLLRLVQAVVSPAWTQKALVQVATRAQLLRNGGDRIDYGAFVEWLFKEPAASPAGDAAAKAAAGAITEGEKAARDERAPAAAPSKPAASLEEYFASKDWYTAGRQLETKGTGYSADVIQGGVSIFKCEANGAQVLREAWDLTPAEYPGEGVQVLYFRCPGEGTFERVTAETVLSEETWGAIGDRLSKVVRLISCEPSGLPPIAPPPAPAPPASAAQPAGSAASSAAAAPTAGANGAIVGTGLLVPVLVTKGAAVRCTGEAASTSPPGGAEEWELMLPAEQAASLSGASTERRRRRALELKRIEFGDQHASTLAAMNDLAFILEGRGKVAEASEICAKTLEVYKVVFGESHADTLTCMNNLAYLLDQSGQGQEAETLAREVLKGRESALGHEHPDTNTAVYNLAELLEARGLLDEAEKLFVREHEWCKRTYGARHRCTLESGKNLLRFRKMRRKADGLPFMKVNPGKFTSANV